ncbi:uncharacterized protein EHS24_003956 [Apiotrichum porosum]|uniref:Uncharacterized protein n=1 Tax=Apiotrichum porosum TaxID=105984 RepID=A0A427XDT2_9TREE|nr:uncharacterized protein EHS24_003956 [Apiotrichum porosum]RSH77015.1 hypothetical protein EHS24_003956 [Apiotrichum porosum]
MSNLQYFTYPGYGEEALEKHKYSQAVRIGDRIECSGQGGWDRATSKITEDLGAEIDQAFENVDVAVKAAIGKGWSQVFRMTTYHVVLNEEIYVRMKMNIDKWLPDHKPIWTCIGVAKLAFPGMNVEIEVAAYDPK